MDITEVSMIHHVAIVLLALWFLNSFNYCHPIWYFMSLIYLFLVHERYVVRLRKKLQFEERKQANQRKVLCDSETVRWLNYAVEKMWPICMEQIASQKILLPIMPWFLDKYKPWTAKKAVVQSLYLGRNPPMFTEMRVLRESNDDDHLVMELGMNFLTADDMSAILAVQLRKRLGFGMWTKLHMTGLHIEGKVLIGVKFLRQWPFLGRIRLCFVEPPYLQMTVKPLFNHGIDVTELPGIAGWLDNFLSIAFEQTLVEPNMLVVDLEKFVSPQSESWFSVDEKEPVAFVKVEVIEASDMKSADMNGFSDPYVKAQLGSYRLRTKTQKKTLSPKWQEEFKIPICSWDSPNVLAIEVCDKDHFIDDTLGDCSVNIDDLRDGQRHDMWLSLQNVKTGRLRLAVTVLQGNGKAPHKEENPFSEEAKTLDEEKSEFTSEGVKKGSFSSILSDKSPKVADIFEPIDVQGQEETGIWVQQPGSEVSQTWEPRKGKGRRLDNSINSTKSQELASNNDSSSTDESVEGGKNHMSSVRRGLQKISSVFHRSPKEGDDHSGSLGDEVINTKDSLSVPVASSEGSGPESPKKGHAKGMAKSVLKHTARGIRHVLSKKGSKKGIERDICAEFESSEDEEPSLTPGVERVYADSNPRSSSSEHQGVDSSEMEDENPSKSLDMYDDDKLVLESTKQEGLDRKDTSFANQNI